MVVALVIPVPVEVERDGEAEYTESMMIIWSVWSGRKYWRLNAY